MEQHFCILGRVGKAVHYEQIQRPVALLGARLISNGALPHHHLLHRRPLFSLKSCQKYVMRAALSTSAAQDWSSKPSSSSSPPSSAMGVPPQAARELHDVVIAGAGIAGLAMALAFHRLGVKPVVLEQSERLRTAGATIGLWTNAWKALEALGVADDLRKQFPKMSGLEIFGEDGSLIKCLDLKTGTTDVELRGVERKALLETLREPLPDSTVFYDSHVVGITRLDGGYTEVKCKNGRTFQTKVLIGCDGAGSVVAKYMNMGELKYAGYVATRGLAVYPNGHNLSRTSKQVYGRGVRVGVAPMDANRVYWFVMFNSPEGELVTDVELVREEALNYAKGFPAVMIREAIDRSSSETLSRRAISDRWMWPVGGPARYQGGVTLAGDAMHPMTPNLGQGGCCALEDAVVLARGLSKALSTKSHPPPNGAPDAASQEMERIELALKSYTEERWPRTLGLTIRSHITGALLQVENGLICRARNRLLQKLVNVDGFADHTRYDCGTLMEASRRAG